MIDNIKKAIYKDYNPEEKKWLFLSWFSKDRKLVVSQWLVFTDNVLSKNIDGLYEAYILPETKHIMYVVCDIVADIVDYSETPWEFLKLSPKEYWFIAIDKEDDLSGVILPNTLGVVDAKSALYDLKKKYGIHGQVELYAFRTKRLVIAK